MKSDTLNQLHERLEKLIDQQSEFHKEIMELKSEIYKLKNQEAVDSTDSNISFPETDQTFQPVIKEEPLPQQERIIEPADQYKKSKSNIERFIGENLISKIGIAILVIGVGIGSKYAIENSHFGPGMRIAGGYLLGLAIMALALRLKKNYLNYSAVLFSGSVAVLYFISFAAYSMYNIFPQYLSFILLFLITILTVFAALKYDQQVIAHFGMVGAYLIPFIVGGDSENYFFLLTYTAMVNIGVLAVSLYRNWKAIYISAFFVTLIIFIAWLIMDYERKDEFVLAMSFVVFFFCLFLSSFVIYKIRFKSEFSSLDISLILLNSLAYYLVGYVLVSNLKHGEDYLGLYTLSIAVVHAALAGAVFALKIKDRSMFHLLSGLVVVFLTIIFPIQFDGNWVTILWGSETLILLLVGRYNQRKIYELLSYAVFILAFGSLVHDWIVQNSLNSSEVLAIKPFLHFNFLASLFMSLLFVGIYLIDNIEHFRYNAILKNRFYRIFSIIIPVAAIISIYFSITFEISLYWQQQKLLAAESFPNIIPRSDYNSYRFIWILNFTLLYLSVLNFSQSFSKAIKHKLFLLLNFISIFVFLFGGLYYLSELRETFISSRFDSLSANYYNIYLRYISLLFFFTLLVSCKKVFMNTFSDFKALYEIIFTGAVLWILSSELLQWLDFSDAQNNYKLGISILWVLYALLLIVWGIKKSGKHLRISAFILVGITLVKVFFYDLDKMNTIRRAILFVSIGLLLLGISYLYNRYKDRIFDSSEDE
ncbi:MAG: DUF2339 domain-containing protein [Bacteroidales bacterium]|nr:DUF2339 domain-containing protein [Bacteroidales bacterium]MBN2818477.1 DUF2339 domain-containing protein [Bacteroidales bacterium]